MITMNLGIAAAAQSKTLEIVVNNNEAENVQQNNPYEKVINIFFFFKNGKCCIN